MILTSYYCMLTALFLVEPENSVSGFPGYRVPSQTDMAYTNTTCDSSSKTSTQVVVYELIRVQA